MVIITTGSLLTKGKLTNKKHKTNESRFKYALFTCMLRKSRLFLKSQ